MLPICTELNVLYATVIIESCLFTYIINVALYFFRKGILCLRVNALCFYIMP